MFTEISNLLNDGELLRINVMKKGESLIVTVLPQVKNVEDPAAKQLIPLNLSGTPEELDSGFIEAIKAPVQKSNALMTNMATYEQAADKAARESKAEKDKKEKISKLIKEAETAEKANKIKEAIAAYTKVLEADPTNVKIKLKINTLKLKVNGGCMDMFAPPPTETSEENSSTDDNEEEFDDDDEYNDDNE